MSLPTGIGCYQDVSTPTFSKGTSGSGFSIKAFQRNVDCGLARAFLGQNSEKTEFLMQSLPFSARKVTLESSIAKAAEAADIVCLQELRKVLQDASMQDIEVLADMNGVLEKSGMATVIEPYNTIGYSGDPNKPDLRMFHLVGYKESMGCLKDSVMVYFTQQPETDDCRKIENTALAGIGQKEFAFGESFPRGALRLEFEKNGQPIFVYNIHLGLGQKVKSASAEILKADIEKLKAQHPAALFMLMGDYNTFSDAGGNDHLETLLAMDNAKDACQSVPVSFMPTATDYGKFGFYSAITGLFAQENLAASQTREARTDLIARLIRTAAALSVLEDPSDSRPAREKESDKALNDQAADFASSDQKLATFIEAQGISEEEANQRMAGNGYPLGNRPLDHAVCVGENIEVVSCDTMPEFTDKEFWLNRELTPLNYFDYLIKMISQDQPVAASDHMGIVTQVRINPDQK